jgi:hypothetical protein
LAEARRQELQQNHGPSRWSQALCQ